MQLPRVQSRLSVSQVLSDELKRQLSTANLIASENFPSKATLSCLSSRIQSKYAEGSPSKRYYKGCENADIIEECLEGKIRDLSGWKGEISVQPHAGAGANLAAYLAQLSVGDKILALSLKEGGHLSHGSSVSATSRIFRFKHFGLHNEIFDYNILEAAMRDYRPKMLVVGFSSYPRDIDFSYIKQLCQKYNCLLHCDVSHTIGLILSGLMNSPFYCADSVMFTTHKTFRGARGAILLCPGAKKAVFPSLQGGPFLNNMAANAVAAEQCGSPIFQQNSQKIQYLAKKYASLFDSQRVFTQGTDCHYFVLKSDTNDLEDQLEQAGIIVSPQQVGNRHGIRIGFPFIVNMGAQEQEIDEIMSILQAIDGGQSGAQYRDSVSKIMQQVAIRLGGEA